MAVSCQKRRTSFLWPLPVIHQPAVWQEALTSGECHSWHQSENYKKIASCYFVQRLQISYANWRDEVNETAKKRHMPSNINSEWMWNLVCSLSLETLKNFLPKWSIYSSFQIVRSVLQVSALSDTLVFASCHPEFFQRLLDGWITAAYRLLSAFFTSAWTPPHHVAHGLLTVRFRLEFRV